MKHEFHKKNKSRPFEKRKDKASIQKETISKKLRLKNNIKNFSDNSTQDHYNGRDRDIDDLYNL